MRQFAGRNGPVASTKMRPSPGHWFEVEAPAGDSGIGLHPSDFWRRGLFPVYSGKSTESSSAPPVTEVTRILSAIEQGDPHAAEQLLPPEKLRLPAAPNRNQGDVRLLGHGDFGMKRQLSRDFEKRIHARRSLGPFRYLVG